MPTNHTPGPWRVAPFAPVNGVTLSIDDDFGLDGGRDYSLAEVTHGDPDELRANAALVASAPDLLDALRAVSDDLVALLAQRMPREVAEQLTSLEAARAAIARAEGRS